jgi:hypothetical protein
MNSQEIFLTIKAVSTELCKMISLYEETKCYNVVPEKGFSHIDEFVEKKFAEMHALVSSLSPDDEEEAKVAEKLHNLIDETECFVKSYTRPGTVDRWVEINPRLVFFYDVVFDLMEELDEETYSKMQQGLTWFGFRFYPDEEFIEARKEYFEKINQRNAVQHLNYSEERIFQDEMLNTLKYVLLNDFKEYLG